MPNQKNHIAVYDVVRILAALLVVLGHSTYLTITTDHGGIDYAVPSNVSAVYGSGFFKTWLYLSAWVYRFHIPLFFMLAGSVLALNPIENFKTLLTKKTRRLLLPFFLTGLFFMIPLKLWGGFFDVRRIPEIAAAFLTGHESGHLWFLTALFWCFAVFFLLQKLLKKSVPVCLAAFLFYIFSSRLPQGYFDFAFSMRFLIFFAAGYYFDRVRPFFEKHPKTVFLLLPCLLILNIVDTQTHFLPAIGFMAAGCALFYNAAFCLALIFKKTTQTPFFRKTAGRTMEIYLFHDPLMIVVLYYCMQADLLTTPAGCWIYFFCRTAGVVLLSVLIGIVIERNFNRVKSVINHRRAGFQRDEPRNCRGN